MMKSVYSSVILLAFLLNGVLFANAQQRAANRFTPSEKDRKRVDKLLKKMSVEEKVGQLQDKKTAEVMEV